jgi:hypothetical protein
VALACASGPRGRQAAEFCAPFDPYGELLLSGSRRLHSDTSLIVADARARSRRPLRAPDDIRYVSDERVCRHVAAAIAARKRGSAAPPRRVRVIWEGDGYLATDFPFETYQLERTPSGGLVLDHGVGVLYRLSATFEIITGYWL